MKNEENKETQKQDTIGSNLTTENLAAGTTSQASGASVQRAKEKSPENENSEGAVAIIKESAQGLMDKAKDTAGQAYEMATERATSKIEEQRQTLTSGLTSVAGSIKQVGESLRESGDQTAVTELTAEYGEIVAGRVEQLAEYFKKNDLRAMASDVEDFGRRNPAVFIGGAFALGILAARFLKSSKGDLVSGEQAAIDTGKRRRSGMRRHQSESDNIVNFADSVSNKNTTSAKGSEGTAG